MSIPLRVPFRGLTQREALIFKGSKRWAEFSPFVEYEDHEALRWLEAALSFANDPLPHLYRNQVGINATLPAIAPAEIPAALRPFGEFRTVKIKIAQVGQTRKDDLVRIKFVADHYRGVRIRLDANGGLSVSEALDFAKQLSEFSIEYLEQPVATISELAQLKSLFVEHDINIPIAADESIRKASDPLEVARLKAADIAVLKVQPLGGIASALAIASESGLEPVISSALETSIGISQGLYLAAGVPALERDCGLGTASLLAGDVVSNPLIPIDGMLSTAELEPDPELLLKYAASEERTAWWLQRLGRCLELLKS